MKVKVTASQDRLDKWGAPNLRTGDVLTVEPSEYGFSYLIVDTEYEPEFWLPIPQYFAEEIK